MLGLIAKQGRETMTGEALRIIDANLNRIAEGLRVLEDVALHVGGDLLAEELQDRRGEVDRLHEFRAAHALAPASRVPDEQRDPRDLVPAGHEHLAGPAVLSE